MRDRYRHFYNNRNNDKGSSRRNKDKSSSGGIRLNKKQRMLARLTLGTLFIFVLVVVFGSIFHIIKRNIQNDNMKEEPEVIEVPALAGVADRFPDLPITEDFLTVNDYSRPGLALASNPQYIVIHYTANPGSTAKQNRDYFENLKDTHQTYASAQFVIGLEGEIEQCVPCDEMAYCSNSLNDVCISIEMCHPYEDGNFNDATYNNCVFLVAHLMNYYHIDMDHLIRHYDVTGKNCPKYFVEHPDRWEVFKDFVAQYREKYKDTDYNMISENDEITEE